MRESIIGGEYKTVYNEFYQKHDEAWRMPGSTLEKKACQQFANAYTVLCKKADHQLRLF